MGVNSCYGQGVDSQQGAYGSSRRRAAEQVLAQALSDTCFQGSPRQQALLDSAIHVDSTYSPAWFEQSVAFTKTGDYATAFVYLNKAVALDPRQHLGYRGWLKVYKLHDYWGAIRDLNRLDSLTPGYADLAWEENVHCLLSIAYKQLGLYDQALRWLNQGIEEVKLKPGLAFVQPYFFVYRGLVHHRLKHYGLALADYQQAIALQATNLEAYYYQGQTLTKLGRYKSAKRSYQLAYRLFRQGYKRRDPYKELPDEVYESDLLSNLHR